jgi:uncharacterized membrane protein (UPF0127 family)
LFRAPLNIPLLLVLSAGLIACKKDDTTLQSPAASVTPIVSTAASPAISATPRGQPQEKLPTLKLWAGTNGIVAEIASSRKQIETGMMWRTNMAEMEGMLFVFAQPHQVAFFMKNTLLPLSCAYIDPDGVVLEIHHMKPLDETPIQSRSHQVQYVLEMNQGWFDRHGVKPGAVFSTEHGSFAQTFRRR